MEHDDKFSHFRRREKNEPTFLDKKSSWKSDKKDPRKSESWRSERKDSYTSKNRNSLRTESRDSRKSKYRYTDSSEKSHTSTHEKPGTRSHLSVPTSGNQRQKTVAITLSALAILSLCIIGFQLWSKNSDDPKQLTILPQNRNLDQYTNDEFTLHPSKTQNTEGDSYGEYPIIFSKKGRIHGIRENLFSNESPQSQAKLAKMNQELSENAHLINALNSRIRQLEREKDEIHNKVGKAEHNVEQLIAMRETPSAIDETLFQRYTDEIETLRNDATTQKDEFEKMIQQLEESETEVKQTLLEKTIIIGTLKDQIDQLASQTNDNDATTQKDEFEKMIQQLEESETEVKQTLLEKTIIIGTLKDQIDQLASQTNDNDIYVNNLEEKVHNLNISLEAEMTKNQQHNRIVESLLDTQESEFNTWRKFAEDLKAYEEKIVDLEDNLAIKEKEISALNQELIDLTLSLEFEITKAKQFTAQSRELNNHKELERDNQITTQKKQLESLQQLTYQLTIAIEFEQTQNRKLQEIFNEFTKKHEADIHQLVKHEQIHKKNHQEIIDITSRLEDKQEEIKKLNKENDRLSDTLQLEKTKSQRPQQSINYVAEEQNTPKKSITKKAETTTHIVLDGETLSTIAIQYYGSPQHWIKIYEFNRDVILDKTQLEIGTKLTIPKK